MYVIVMHRRPTLLWSARAIKLCMIWY